MPINRIIRTDGGKELREPNQVVVTERLGQTTTFTITFSEDVCKGDFPMLVEEAFNPLQKIEILIEDEKGRKIYLVKGLVQSQQITLKHGGQGSQLVVSGSDNSIRMDWVMETKDWQKKMEQADILSLLSGVNKHVTADEKKKLEKEGQKVKVADYPFVKYNMMGGEFSNREGKWVDTKGQELSKIEEQPELNFGEGQVQRGTDLQFIRQLAELNNMYFWISYNDQGEEIANFKELPPKEEADLTLIINHDDNNIDEFSISWDADRPTGVESYQIAKRDKQEKAENIDRAPQPKLSHKTLADLTSGLITTMLPVQADDEGTLRERSNAALNKAEWFITANCATTYERLNKYCKAGEEKYREKPRVIHAHTIVNVMGAGSRHSGSYVVSGVTHTIDAESYKMQVELMRNSWNDPAIALLETLASPFTNTVEAARNAVGALF